MHSSTAIVALASLLSLAFAQQTYVIDPSTVSSATRQYWCDQQQTQCPLICLQTTTGVPTSNDCTASTLTYGCVCSDGLSPNLTQYSQTLPYFICTEWGTQCVSNCGGDAGCASDCRSEHPCGAQGPARVNVSTASAGATASATSGGSSGSEEGAVQTGFASRGGGSGGSGEAEQDNGAKGLGAAAGWAVLVGGFVFGFAAVL